MTLSPEQTQQTGGGANGSSGQTGRIARVLGPVIDVEFPRDNVPELFNALNFDVTLGGETKTLTLEVAQHLGENQVRCIAMQPTDGVVRG